MDTKTGTSLVFIGIGFLYIGYAVYSLIKGKKASFWPRVAATITKCTLVEDYDEAPVFQVEISYSYDVLGKKYDGFRLYHGYQATGERKIHDAIFDRLKDAKRIEVRYNPLKPQDSVISCEPGKMSIANIIIGSLFIFFSSAALLYTLYPDKLDTPVFWGALTLTLISGCLAFVKLLSTADDRVITGITVIENK